jgi:hypothetical protein
VFVVDGEEKQEVEVQLKDIKRRLDRAGRRPVETPPVMIASIQTETGVNNDQIGDDDEPTEGTIAIHSPSS